MYANGFVKVVSCSPKTKTGDAQANVLEMLNCLLAIDQKAADFVLFPELCVCGYSIGDLIFQKYLYVDNLKAIEYFLNHHSFSGVVIIGTYLFVNDVAYNCALIIQGHDILGIVPKIFLPHAYEFYENRWFASGETADIDFLNLFGKNIPFGKLVFSNADEQVKFGVEICEDYWSMASPHEGLYANGAMIVFNCSASPEEIGKGEKRILLAQEASYKGTGAYVYTSNNCSESTSEVVFSNQKIICENGEILENYNYINLESDFIIADIDIQKLHYIRRRKSWPKNLNNRYEPHEVVPYQLIEKSSFVFEKPMSLTPFLPTKIADFDRIIEMQAVSVKKRLDYIGIHRVVIGVSGGLDSTLALMSLCRMVDLYDMSRKDIIAVTLPSSNTSSKTYQNALALMKMLQVSVHDFPIEEDVLRQAKTIGLDAGLKDVTYENIQSRYRTYTLMNLANLHQAIVIGTSDMSEVALGWSTFNGDQMAMYGINAGLPKTVVREVVRHHGTLFPEVASFLKDIINTPISPELSGSSQETEQIIGKYEINDFILYHFWVNGDTDDRLVWLLGGCFGLTEVEAKRYVSRFFKKFYSQQYKRLTMPESVKILEMSLSPRTETRLNGDIYKPEK
ncbi:MAG: NAD(+) synthase [Bacilli bacterium]